MGHGLLQDSGNSSALEMELPLCSLAITYVFLLCMRIVALAILADHQLNIFHLYYMVIISC